MIHVSELSDDQSQANEIAKEGASIEFIVLASDSEERRFSLSHKALAQQLEGEQLRRYISEVAEPKTGLADAFAKAKLALGTDKPEETE